MNTRRTLTILVAATLTAGITTAVAQQGNFGPGFGPGGGGQGGRGQPMMLQADSNGDGQISQVEFDAFRTERHEAMAAAGRPMRNLDNAPAFTDMDIDGDGYIVPDEMRAFHAEQRGNMGPGMGPGMGRGMGPGRGGPGRQGGGPRLQGFDTDNDGYLSQQEFTAAHEARQAQRAQQGRPMVNAMDPAERFEQLDADDDGRLSLDELRAGRRQGRGRWNS